MVVGHCLIFMGVNFLASGISKLTAYLTIHLGSTLEIFIGGLCGFCTQVFSQGCRAVEAPELTGIL